MLTLGLFMALLGAWMKVILYGTAEPFLASQVKSMWSTSAGMTWNMGIWSDMVKDICANWGT